MPDDKKGDSSNKYSKLIRKTASEDEPQGLMYSLRSLPALSDIDKQNMLNLLRQTSSVTGLSILTLALISAVILTQQNQDLRSKAKEVVPPVTPTYTPTTTPTPTVSLEEDQDTEVNEVLPEDIPQPHF